MKSSLRSVLFLCLSVAIVGLMSYGCDAIANATSVDVPIDVVLHPESVNPDIPTVDIDCADLNSIKDYADNKDMIEGGELQKATFKVTDLIAPTFEPATAVLTDMNFHLEFDPVYGDTKSYHIGAFSMLAFNDVMTSPMDIPLNDDARAAISKILAGQEKFCIKASYGPLTTGPASASYLRGELTLTVKFKASVL